MGDWITHTGTAPEGEVEVQLTTGAKLFGDAKNMDWSNVDKWRRPDNRKDAAAILRMAAGLIEQRAEQRDSATGEKSMAKTVEAFNAIYGTQLTEVQGWHFMELLKMVRSAYGIYVEDDYLDKVAYAALAAEAAQ